MISNISKNSLKTYLVFIFINLILIFIISQYSRDLNSYKIFYDHSIKYNISDMYQKFYYEPGFIFVFYFLCRIFHFYDAFLILSSLCLVIKLGLLTNIDRNRYLAVFLYVFLQLLAFHDASQLRTSIATVFIIYALVVDNKKFVFYIFLTAFGILFHKVCIIILLFYNIRVFLLAIIPIIFISIFQDYIIVMLKDFIDLQAYHTPSYGKKAYGAILTSASKLNSFFWSLSIIGLISLLGFNKLNDIQKKSVLLILIGCTFYICFVDSANIASRFIEVSIVGLIPLVCSDKINFNLKWIVKYTLIGYIIIYQTTNMAISIFNT